MKNSEKTSWFVLIPGAAVVCIFFLSLPLIVEGFVVKAYKIPSASMSPTLMAGDLFLADKSISGLDKIQRGDIIIFAFPPDPSKDFVKRVIGLPGESIEIRDKGLYIDGELMEEQYVVHKDHRIYPGSANDRDNMASVRVPADSLFVMGDNRDASNDSRFWGFVDARHVKGKATFIYWSWNKEEIKVRWTRIGQAIH